MSLNKTTIRLAKADDMPAVHTLVQELAVYERAPEAVSTTPETYIDDAFATDLPWFECHVAERDGELLGIALCCRTYSTWKGRCYYLEDFVVKEPERGQGVGKHLFAAYVTRARELKAERLAWQVLDWNTPAIHFYKRLGAKLDPEWINGRVEGGAAIAALDSQLQDSAL